MIDKDDKLEDLAVEGDEVVGGMRFHHGPLVNSKFSPPRVGTMDSEAEQPARPDVAVTKPEQQLINDPHVPPSRP